MGGSHSVVWQTADAGQLALIKAMFDSKSISYYINNENFAMTHGLAVPAQIFVAQDQLNEAKEIIADFIQD